MCSNFSFHINKKKGSSFQSPWWIFLLFHSKFKRKMWTKKIVKRLVDSFFLFQHIGRCSVFTEPTGMCWTRKWGGHIPDRVEVVKISKACWATGKCFTVSPDYLRLSCHPLDLNKFPKSPSQIKMMIITNMKDEPTEKVTFFSPSFFSWTIPKVTCEIRPFFLGRLEESATWEVSTSPEGKLQWESDNTPGRWTAGTL